LGVILEGLRGLFLGSKELIGKNVRIFCKKNVLLGFYLNFGVVLRVLFFGLVGIILLAMDLVVLVLLV